MLKREETYAYAVCGGGLAGFCAAVAAARQGVRTCLIHDRPVFGGNSSSEIKVVPHGAARFHAYARETGIVSELLIEALYRNYDRMNDAGSNATWDQIMYDVAMSTPNLTFYLNTSIISVQKKSPREIGSVTARIAGAEVELRIAADIFADCTGDGIVADLAGCESRIGTESRAETGEPHAPLHASDGVMGSSILFRAVDTGKPAPFSAPAWAAKYDDASFFYEKGHSVRNVQKGYWWMAISAPWHTIHDNENIRHELTRHILGVWDWIKNKDPKTKDRAAHMALDWIGQIPGKRESRRITGKYRMTERDAIEAVVHPDEVAFGGWFIDIHSPHGLLDPERPEYNHDPEDARDKPSLVCGPYGLPLGILLARDVDNLMMAGRNVSVTHMALGTVRVMLTTALMGQAAGTAAAVALQRRLTFDQMYETDSVRLVQQQLLRDGCFLPNCSNRDEADLARLAVLSASSEAWLHGVGPDSRGTVRDLGNQEKIVDKHEPLPPGDDKLLQRRGQWVALGTDRLETISVCLSNRSGERQPVGVQLVAVDHIWDYRTEGLPVLAEGELSVPPGSLQWVDWALNLTGRHGLAPGTYVRLDLFPNPNVIWHCAGAIQPGMVSAFDVGLKMRRYKYGRTLSFRVKPAQPCYSPANAVSGVARPYRHTNLWRSDPNQPLPQWIQLNWAAAREIRQIEITFAGHLFREFEHAGEGAFYADPATVKDYRIMAWTGGSWRELLHIQHNYQRRRVHPLPAGFATDRLRIEILRTNGDCAAAVYEVRCY